MSDQDDVFGGVDTHRDVHVAAVVDATGRVLGTASFGADTAGYEQLGHWLGSHGNVAHVGIEGTGSYGAGAGVGRNGAGNGEVSRNTGAEVKKLSAVFMGEMKPLAAEYRELMERLTEADRDARPTHNRIPGRVDS